MRKFFVFFLLISCFISCKNNTSQEILKSIRIISPKENREYKEDELLFFTSNVDSSDIKWYSSLDGKIGNGNNISTYLSIGCHTIKCVIGDFEKKVIINVKENVPSKGECKKFLLNDKSKIFLYPGQYSLFVCCLDKKLQSAYVQKKEIDNSVIKKDITINNKYNSKKIETKSFSSRNVSSNYSIGEKRQLNIVKTTNQFDEPHVKNCICISIGEHYTAWVLEDDIYNSELINECVENFDNFLFKRLSAIWGDWADVDGDGKIAFLFSSTINNEEYAIGFFNSNDLFQNENSNYSNQMDILYLGLPVSDTNGAYSVSSITATIAHELTHAINYNQKTYKSVLLEKENIVQEEIFIDESFSHLSENLCGYGESGGNIDFVKYFLRNSSDYSFCGKNRFGEDDSVGRRGAMLLFMSWLFWKKGGFSWDYSDPSKVIDEGGIKFLKQLVKSEYSSWENIGEVFGIPISQLFIDFVNDINSQQFTNNPLIIDPITNELVVFYSNIDGILNENLSIFEENDYLPWSFSKSNLLKIDSKSIYQFSLLNYDNFVLSFYVID